MTVIYYHSYTLRNTYNNHKNELVVKIELIPIQLKYRKNILIELDLEVVNHRIKEKGRC